MPQGASTTPSLVPRGLATGIGSLPHTDPQVATRVVVERLPACPFWPQLPRRSPLEGMTLQYLEGFPALRERGEGRDPVVAMDEEGLGDLAVFFERALGGDRESFALSRDRAPGLYALQDLLAEERPAGLRYVKGHVTGPVTLATSLKNLEGQDVLHDDSFREAVGILVAQKALWQKERLARFGVPVVIFLDEPVMEVYGSAYSTLSRDVVLGLWAPALEALRREGALSGIHCCGNTDWGVLCEAGADIVNFDSCHFLEKMLLYPEAASAFLAAGGVLAWGAVPTDEEARRIDSGALLARLDEGLRRFAERGVDEGLLRRQCLLTPSCGMGSLDVELAERVLDLLADVSSGFQG